MATNFSFPRLSEPLPTACSHAKAMLNSVDSGPASALRVGRSRMVPLRWFASWIALTGWLLTSACSPSDATRIGSKLPRAVMFPRGDRLVVAAYANAMSAILILDTLGAVLDTVVRSDTTYLDCPQWSPKGHEVLFTIFHGGGLSGWERPAFHSNLAIVSLRARAVTMLTRDSGLTNYGRWSRDGLWIVFQSDRHASPTTEESGVAQMMRNLEIWIVRRDGSGLRRLTSNSYFDAHPSW